MSVYDNDNWISVNPQKVGEEILSLRIIHSEFPVAYSQVEYTNRLLGHKFSFESGFRGRSTRRPMAVGHVLTGIGKWGPPPVALLSPLPPPHSLSLSLTCSMSLSLSVLPAVCRLAPRGSLILGTHSLTVCAPLAGPHRQNPPRRPEERRITLENLRAQMTEWGTTPMSKQNEKKIYIYRCSPRFFRWHWVCSIQRDTIITIPLTSLFTFFWDFFLCLCWYSQTHFGFCLLFRADYRDI